MPDGRGLYFIDCTDSLKNKQLIFGQCHKMVLDKSFTEHNTTIETIKDNQTKFSHKDVRNSNIVERVQHVAGHPSEHTLIRMTMKNSIKDCPFPPQAIRVAQKILGPSVYGLKGKQTKRNIDHIEMDGRVLSLPITIKENYKEVTLAADVLHVNEIPFLTKQYCVTSTIWNHMCNIITYTQHS